MSDLVYTQINPPVATCTLNRAERHNSLIPELLDDLLRSLETVSSAAGVRALILQANGKSFSTGGDLRGFAAHLDDIEAYAGKLVGKLNEVILAMLEARMPIIAAVQGLVTGGSLGLLLAADMVLMAPGAQIVPYYAVVGFSPDGGWTAMLPEIIGRQRTAEILMLNRSISAQQALDWDLAALIVESAQIKEKAHHLALQIAELNEGSISAAKRMVRTNEAELKDRLEAERSHFVEQIAKPETQRSMLDFLAEM